MDKFGIFNLLNSFLNPTNASQDANEQTSNPNSNPTNFLDNLLSNINSSPEKKEEQRENKPPKKTSTPLQRQMLSTMKSHDEIIKRVNKTKL